MQFYFIRHGQSENNLLYERTGSGVGRSEDPALTEVGWQQAGMLAQYLARTGPNSTAGFGLTHLYTSLMVRAVATGTMIARALDLPLVAWPDVHELGGIYRHDEQTGERVGGPGHNRTFFETHYPDLVLPDSLGEAGWWRSRPYEEREGRYARAQRFLHELLERHGHTEDRVAVISHGGFYNLFLFALLEIPKRDDCWFLLNNAAITRIDFDGERVELVYMNRVDHLPRELIT